MSETGRAERLKPKWPRLVGAQGSFRTVGATGATGASCLSLPVRLIAGTRRQYTSFLNSSALEEVRQFDNVRRNPPRFIFCEQLGRRSPARLVLEINKRQLLPGAVLHDEARLQLIDGPG